MMKTKLTPTAQRMAKNDVRIFSSVDIDSGSMDKFEEAGFTYARFSGSAVTTDGTAVFFDLICQIDPLHKLIDYCKFPDDDYGLFYCSEAAEAEILRTIGAAGLKELHERAGFVWIEAGKAAVAIENCFVTVIGADVVFVLPDGKAFVMAPAVDTDDEGAIEVWAFENVNDEAPIGGGVVAGETVAAVEAAGGSIIVEGADVPLNELEKDALKEAENYCRGKDVAFTGPYYF